MFPVDNNSQKSPYINFDETTSVVLSDLNKIRQDVLEKLDPSLTQTEFEHHVEQWKTAPHNYSKADQTKIEAAIKDGQFIVLTQKRPLTIAFLVGSLALGILAASLITLGICCCEPLLGIGIPLAVFALASFGLAMESLWGDFSDKKKALQIQKTLQSINSKPVNAIPAPSKKPVSPLNSMFSEEHLDLLRCLRDVNANEHPKELSSDLENCENQWIKESSKFDELYQRNMTLALSAARLKVNSNSQEGFSIAEEQLASTWKDIVQMRQSKISSK